MTEQIAAIVPAAGAGIRLVADESDESDRADETPKALRLLDGVPLLRHAIRSLEHAVSQVVVPASPDLVDEIRAAVRAVAVPVVVVEGGQTRQESVRRALAALDPAITHVLVHDAARPLCPPAVTDRVVAALRAEAQAVVPVVEVTDTLRYTDGDRSHTVDRSAIRAVQTPQGFPVDVLRRAHAEAGADDVSATDDASIAERIGAEVVLVEGDPRSFKITRSLDLALAQALIAQPT